MKILAIAFSTTLIAAFVCPGCCRQTAAPVGGQGDDVAIDSDPTVKIGAQRAHVLKALGEPAEKTELVKGPEPIFGVVETWWNTLTDGDKIEIWRYPKPEGTLQVYFLNDGDTVWHTASVGKNVVF
jgi:hypothetical protein